MLSIIVVVIVFSILIFVHESGHYFMARRCGVKVERFSLGFGPKLFSINRDGTEYRISAVPLGGYVKLAGENYEDEVTGAKWEFLSKAPGVRFKIIAAGPILNYILGFLLFSAVFMIGAPTLTNKVGDVLDDYPAKKAGIRAGDRIVAIDGEEIVYWHELTQTIREKFTDKVELKVLRGNRTLHINIEPRIREFKDIFGKDVKIAMVGIAPSDELIFLQYGPFKSIKMGLVKIYDLTILTFRALWGLVTGSLPLKESVTGPVGIFVMTAKAAKMGFVYLLNLMAIISTSLAIFNVLPIPVLDGGHILFLAIEKIKGRPLSRRVQETAIQMGLSLLILLMLVVFYFDIMRMINK